MPRKEAGHSKSTKGSEKGSRTRLRDDQLAAFADEILQKDDQLAEFRQVVESLKQQLAAFQSLSSHLKQQLSEEKQRFLDADRQLTVFSQQLIDKNRKIQTLDMHINTLVEKLRSSEKKNQELSNQQQEKNRELSQLRKGLSSHRERLEILESANKELVSKNQLLEDERYHLLDDIRKLTQMVDQKEQEMLFQTKRIRDEYEHKIKSLIKEHTRSELESGALIVELRRLLEEQGSILRKREDQEKRLAAEISKKLQSLASGRSSSAANGVMKDYKRWKNSSEGYLVKEAGSENFSELEHVLPMVKIAMERHEPVDKIVDSLVNSGYDKETVELAVARLLR
ncbi:hypothetical protein GF351_02295 [Candidatus Woesearchaeota archaeon]|nr:hypothetical protein [Candidatus Woesearchaeota archaeon]